MCQPLWSVLVLERAVTFGSFLSMLYRRSPRVSSAACCLLLTRTMERRHQVGLDSYDRFFPNQDTMPKGGLGNLIALPLQFGPRKADNSVFIDSDFRKYPDQWHFFSTVRRMPIDAAEEIVAAAQRKGDLIG